jgi:hypothetical protein
MYPIEHGDYYLVDADFESYVKCQEEVDREYCDQANWVRKCITSTALMGRFSSDRTIREYASDIWGIRQMPLPQVQANGAIMNPPIRSSLTGSVGSLRRHHRSSSSEFEGREGSVGSGGRKMVRFGSSQSETVSSDDSESGEVKIEL